MNQRIEQLAEQCWVHTNEPLFSAKSPHWEFDRQKFAELIVRECANICFSEAEGHSMAFGEHCGIVIKEHFGVEG